LLPRRAATRCVADHLVNAGLPSELLFLKELGGQVDESMLRFKRSFEAHVATIKGSLAQWLSEHRSDSTAARIALLETAFDGCLAERASRTSDFASAAAEATDMVQAVLRRAVQRRRAALRISESRKSRPSGIPVNDEEVAKRLTEMLNLLDLVADSLPKDAALRQFIGDAVDPLGTLVGYFAGGIDSSAPTRAPEGHPPARDPDTPIESYPIEEW